MTRSFNERLELFRKSDIYPVVTSAFCNGRSVTEVLSGIAAGGAKIVQIREKSMSDNAMFQLLAECKKITDKFNMLLIVDDRVDLAMAIGADGVHLGQDDFPLAEAVKLAPEMLFGCSTHNADEIAKAQLDNCSYLNIGPVFPTQTKSVPCGALGLETVQKLKTDVRCPFSVMGGIKEHHLSSLIQNNFRHIAMVTEITSAPDVEQKVKQLRKYWN